jgi:hypothetical protein
VLYELVTHEVPFASMSAADAAAVAAIHGTRPALPDGTPPAVRELLCQCWSAERKDRPSFEALGKQLGTLRAELTSQQLEWLDASLGHSPPPPPAANAPAAVSDHS